MTIKIDFEKAYDQVRWDFIDASLQATGIPIYLRNFIVSTISNSTMWNGVPFYGFYGGKGSNEAAKLGCSPVIYYWLGHFSAVDSSLHSQQFYAVHDDS